MNKPPVPRRPRNLSRPSITILLLIILFVLLIGGTIWLGVGRSAGSPSGDASFIPGVEASTTPASTRTPAVTRTSTSVPTLTPTMQATEFVREKAVIGSSVNGLSIFSNCLGTGGHVLVLVAGIHGDEDQPRQLVEQIMDYFTNNPQEIPGDVKICGIENMNPDGSAATPPQRFNAHTVDLNRNWDTSDWVSDITRGNGVLSGGGGGAPLSEPENIAVAQFLLGLQSQASSPVIVFFYHSTVQAFSDVRPGYTMQNGEIVWGALSSQVAQNFAAQINYEYLHTYEYPISGESLHWMADHGFVSVGVELPDSGFYTDELLMLNLQAFMRLLSSWPEYQP